MKQNANLVFELGTEELPTGSVTRLSEALGERLKVQLNQEKINFEQVKTFATPRRISVRVEKIATQQPQQTLFKKGPSMDRAVTASGEPTASALGFAKSVGATFEELEKLETNKGTWLVYNKKIAGENTADLLPKLLQQVAQNLPLDKSMRWEDKTYNFVRPLHWVLALLDETIIPLDVFGVGSDRFTYGHRIHSPEPIAVPHADDYEALLEKTGYVVACFNQRRHKIKEQILSIAKSRSGQLLLSDALLNEVTALVEWPVALQGSFDADFLEVPKECLISTMESNQKYFSLLNKDQSLKNEFIFVANLESEQPEQVVAGNERVIRPRLADAAFFYKKDREQTLKSYLPKLKNLTLQAQLGSMWNKSERIRALAEFIAKQLRLDETSLIHVQQAAMLSKADLVTQMVKEFPELQGIMGSYYAAASGESTEVSTAIRDQYHPRFNQDTLPESCLGLCLSLADKIDSLVGFIGIGKSPTGEKDPFGLRRAALGVIRICIEKELDLDLKPLVHAAVTHYQNTSLAVETANQVLDFLTARYKNWYQSLSVPTEVILSVVELNISSPLDFDKRIKAVQSFAKLDAAKNLSIANKRVANLLKRDQKTKRTNNVNPELLLVPAEVALHQKLTEVKNQIQPLLLEKEYQLALEKLATLGPWVDALFDKVMILTEDENVRNNRLALLRDLSDQFKYIADIALLAA